jgi:hypothetical protein
MHGCSSNIAKADYATDIDQFSKVIHGEDQQETTIHNRATSTAVEEEKEEEEDTFDGTLLSYLNLPDRRTELLKIFHTTNHYHW